MGGATLPTEKDLTAEERADVAAICAEIRAYIAASRRWWIHEGLRALHRQRIALRIFQRPLRDPLPFVNTSTSEYRAVFPDGLCVLTSSLPELESLEWMECRLCEALAELETT